MYIIGNKKNKNEDGIVDGIADSHALSFDKYIFQASIFFSLLLCFSQFFTIYADEIIKESDPLVITLTQKKDYAVLLSSLFGNVGRDVPEQASNWAKSLDEYRTRVALQAERNTVLLQLIQGLSVGISEDRREEYNKRILDLKKRIESQKITVVPIIENDAFLSRAIRSSYGLYASFVSGLFERVSDGDPVDKLNDLQSDIFQTYSDLAVLYTQLKNIID